MEFSTIEHCGERTEDRSRTGFSSMDSWIAVRGRGSTGFSTMDRGQGAGEVLRVQHHGQRTCRAFGSVDSGQREACGVQHHGQRSGDGMCTGFSTMDSDSVRGMGSGNGLGEWDGMGWDGMGWDVYGIQIGRAHV